jgi:hypothetical protein
LRARGRMRVGTIAGVAFHAVVGRDDVRELTVASS